MKEYLDEIKRMASVDLDAIDGQIVEWIQDFAHHKDDAEFIAYQCGVGYLKSSLRSIVDYIDTHAIPGIVTREIVNEFAREVQEELRRLINMTNAGLIDRDDGGFYSGGEVRAVRIGDNGNDDIGFELVTSEDGTICDFAVKYGKIFYQDELTDAEALVDELTKGE